MKYIYLFIVFISTIFVSYGYANLTEELEKYLSVTHLPEFLPEGAICAQESSYDRSGGNDDEAIGDNAFFKVEDGKLVLVDLKGPGTIYRIWTPTPTDDIVEFYFDGEKSPRVRVPFKDLFTGKVYPFISPLCGREAGGNYCYLPISYKKSCKILFCGEEIKYFQIQYSNWPDSRQVESFPKELNNEQRKILVDLANLWNEGVFPMKEEFLAPGENLKIKRKSICLMPGETKTFASFNEGGRILALAFSPASMLEGLIKNIILTVTWDDDSVPAINCPLSDFMGFAYGKSAARSLLVGTKENICYFLFPMPFEKSAEFKLTNMSDPSGDSSSIFNSGGAVALESVILFDKNNPKKPNEGKFYAYWNRELPPEGQLYTILNVNGRGHYVGCFLQSQGLEKGKTWFFEGDDVAVIDGEMRIHGTGSEDFFNGGYYSELNFWDDKVNLPLSGSLGYSHPFHRTGGYRLNIADKVAYEKSFSMTMERGDDDRNSIPVDFCSVAFYYADRPPLEVKSIKYTDLMVPIPDEYEYTPKLQAIHAMSLRSALKYDVWMENEDADEEDWIDTYTFTPYDSNSKFILNLDIEVEDDYEIFLSYQAGPTCGRFKVFRRNQQIGESIDSYSNEIVTVEEKYLGNMHFCEGTKTLTFITDGKSPESKGNEIKIFKILMRRLHNKGK